jgi:hypothetical protein
MRTKKGLSTVGNTAWLCHLEGVIIGAWLGMVVHLYNPSYSRGGDRRID